MFYLDVPVCIRRLHPVRVRLRRVLQRAKRNRTVPVGLDPHALGKGLRNSRKTVGCASVVGLTTCWISRFKKDTPFLANLNRMLSTGTLIEKNISSLTHVRFRRISRTLPAHNRPHFTHDHLARFNLTCLVGRSGTRRAPLPDEKCGICTHFRVHLRRPKYGRSAHGAQENIGHAFVSMPPMKQDKRTHKIYCLIVCKNRTESGFPYTPPSRKEEKFDKRPLDTSNATIGRVYA